MKLPMARPTKVIAQTTMPLAWKLATAALLLVEALVWEKEEEEEPVAVLAATEEVTVWPDLSVVVTTVEEATAAELVLVTAMFVLTEVSLEPLMES